MSCMCVYMVCMCRVMYLYMCIRYVCMYCYDVISVNILKLVLAPRWKCSSELYACMWYVYVYVLCMYVLLRCDFGDYSKVDAGNQMEVLE